MYMNNIMRRSEAQVYDIPRIFAQGYAKPSKNVSHRAWVDTYKTEDSHHIVVIIEQFRKQTIQWANVVPFFTIIITQNVNELLSGVLGLLLTDIWCTSHHKTLSFLKKNQLKMIIATYKMQNIHSWLIPSVDFNFTQAKEIWWFLSWLHTWQKPLLDQDTCKLSTDSFRKTVRSVLLWRGIVYINRNKKLAKNCKNHR